MMRIEELWWDEANLEHIARHQITPGEVEAVIFEDEPIVARARAARYAIYGQAIGGRYLVIFVEALRIGRSRQPHRHYPLTARQMTDAERQRYRALI